jgi:hypothetical protein
VDGEIVGFYTVASAEQGFLRSRDGTITTLTLPDGTPLQGQSINAAGEISGSYVDSAGGVHGFLRHRDGRVEVFDAGPQTRPESLNEEGSLTGNYVEPGNNTYGFLRSAQGGITSFKVTGSAFTNPTGINSFDAIVGVYSSPPNIFLFHSFLRESNGVITPLIRLEQQKVWRTASMMWEPSPVSTPTVLEATVFCY